jgi:hypothetical protein
VLEIFTTQFYPPTLDFLYINACFDCANFSPPPILPASP